MKNKKYLIIVIIIIAVLLIGFGIYKFGIKEYNIKQTCNSINKDIKNNENIVVFFTDEKKENKIVNNYINKYKKENIYIINYKNMEKQCIKNLLEPNDLHDTIKSNKSVSSAILYKNGKYDSTYINITNYNIIEKYISGRKVINKM